MRKFYLIFLLTTIYSFTSYSQIGIGTSTPNGYLDISATDNGFLMPRVTLSSLKTELPVTNPNGVKLAISTMVYHIGTSAIAAGYYYWDGSKWQAIANTNDNKGLQYYAFKTSGSYPSIEKSTLSQNILASGLWNVDLNDSARTTIIGSSAKDGYVILFTGTLIVETAGDFQLQSRSDDGTKVIIDNIPVLNTWQDQGVFNFDGKTTYLAKGKHKIEFWYYENNSSEFMEFRWLKNANGTTGTVNADSFIIE